MLKIFLHDFAGTILTVFSSVTMYYVSLWLSFAKKVDIEGCDNIGWKLDGHSKKYSVFLGNFYLIGI